MRDVFRAYFPPTENELEEVWADGLIVLDTNALLNLLRYSKSTRDEFLEVLKARKSQLWLPHQVGVEFLRNAHGIPSEQDALFDGITESLSMSLQVVSADVERALARLNPTEAKVIRRKLMKRFRKLQEDVREVADAHRQTVLSDDEQTRAMDEIMDLYDSAVGSPYAHKELAALHKEAELRYVIRMPPGYMDAKKGIPDRYGDFVIWSQIKAHGKATKLPLIFVTNDQKEDWWARQAGIVETARPELVEEYFVASGQRAQFYTVLDFLEEAKRRGAEVSEHALEEATRVNQTEVVAVDETQAANILAQYPKITNAQVTESMKRFLSTYQASIPKIESSPAMIRIVEQLQSYEWPTVHVSAFEPLLRSYLQASEAARSNLSRQVPQADGDPPAEADDE